MGKTSAATRTRALGVVLLVLLCLLAVARSAVGTRLDSFTIDEPWHIVAGASDLRTGDCMASAIATDDGLLRKDPEISASVFPPWHPTGALVAPVFLVKLANTGLVRRGAAWSGPNLDRDRR